MKHQKSQEQQNPALSAEIGNLSIEQLYKKAVKANEDGDDERVIAICEQIIELDNDNEEALALLAIMQKQNKEKASKLVTEADILFRQTNSNPADVIKLFENALQLDAQNERAKIGLKYAKERMKSNNQLEAFQLTRKAEKLIWEKTFNPAQAIELFEKALILDDQNVDAMYALAQLLVNTPGDAANPVRAIELYEKIIQLDGNKKIDATYELAVMLDKGIGVPANPDKAADLFQQVIKSYEESIDTQRDPMAMVQRAEMYEQGLGGSVNYDEAISLYKMASDIDYPVAKMRLELLEQQKEELKKEGDLSPLFNEIDQMKKYGLQLKQGESSRAKGNLVVELSEQLNHNLLNFLLELRNTMPSDTIKERTAAFRQQFKELAHTQDQSLHQHRAIWKPIVANILLALSGIGLLALIGKAIAHTIDAAKEKKPISLNRSVFFAETKSQKHVGAIEESLEKTELSNPKKN